MREIKFRGFHPDENGKEKVFINGEWINGYWVYGYYFKEMGDFIRQRPSSFFTQSYLVIPETVGQYTGLKDKNGKEIYEWDICQNIKNKKIISVCWHGTFAGFCWHKKKENNKYLYDFGELFRVFDFYEVIGNIYENPELLKD